MKVKIGCFCLFVTLFIGCMNDTNDQSSKIIPKEKACYIPTIDYSIVERLPHDTSSFTEGLCFYNHQLYESTGSPENLPQTKSTLGVFNFKTGKIDIKVELDRKKYFGEGIVVHDGKIYQLTYKNQVGFIYDAKTYNQVGQFNYNNKEGWGLTSDGKYIIMSDGTSTLTYYDPKNMSMLKRLNVTNGGYDEDLINELEYINGYIYANIWTKNYIVKIDPNDGKIVGLLEMSALVNEAKNLNSNCDVINGIAFDSISNKIYVTGKLWKNIYLIEFPH